MAKVGGLADVVGSLPKALAQRGHEVTVILPRYGTVDEARVGAQEMARFSLSVLGRREAVTLKAGTLDHRVPLVLLENSTYFDRPAVYGESDDLERFFFFCRSALEATRHLPSPPDILHCHDWHTGLVPLLARKAGPAAVFTVHNLAYQGPFDYPFLVYSGLRWEYLQGRGNAPILPLSFMAAGILYSDVVNTVSENYAREILTPQYGEGLEQLLGYRQERLFGIVNGIDDQEFNPATDPYLPRPYDAQNREGKAVVKEELQRRALLPQDPTLPVVGMVTRLDEQKGLDILGPAVEEALQGPPFQLVVLGKGRPQYESLVKDLAGRYPALVAGWIAFDNALAHLVYGGSDLFLMPSRFEPCGLGQMIAMRYGTVPIVRRTGGLADTVPDLSPDLKEGRGFVFQDYQSQAMAAAIRRGVEAFGQQKAWGKLQARLMGLDFSWAASATKYEDLYRKALGLKGK